MVLVAATRKGAPVTGGVAQNRTTAAGYGGRWLESCVLNPRPVSDDSVESSRVDLTELSDSLLTVLAKLYVAGRQDDVEGQATGELTNAQYFVLSVVAERGRIRVSELAHAAGVTLSTMSVNVSRLTRSGLLCRPSPTPDGRNSVVALTEFGARVLNSATQVRHRSRQTRIRRLSREEQHSLFDAVPVLRRMIGGQVVAAGGVGTRLAEADGV